METGKMFRFNIHFDLVNKQPFNGVLYKKMVLFLDFFWRSISTCMFYLLNFITRFIFRFQKNDDLNLSTNEISEEDLILSTVLPQDDNQIVSKCDEPEIETEVKPEVIDFKESEYDGFGEKETPKFCFKFQFQNFEGSHQSNRESENSLSPETSPTTSTTTSRYQFLSAKDFSGFMDEDEDIKNFTIKEFYVDSNKPSLNNDEEIVQGGLLTENDFLQLNSEKEGVCDEILKNPEAETSTEDQFSENGSPGKEHISNEVSADSDVESFTLSDGFSVKNHLFDLNSDEFLSERDFGRTDSESLMDELNEEIQSSEETLLQNLSNFDEAADDFSIWCSSVQRSLEIEHEEFDIEELELLKEIQSSEEHDLQNSDICSTSTQILSQKYDHEEPTNEDFGIEDTNPKDGTENFEEPNLDNPSSTESEDSNMLETLWEHQELIEQLKMELKKVKATGLPTILEESESPRMIDDLKPWKIDEKFLHEDRIIELHKFYKSYRERMRKFDILNYQKMYALGFLQLKDPLQSISSKKTSNPTITSILSQNLRLNKRRRPEIDPTVKFVRELEGDLEMVYVGQLCLSWEILHWQYGKVQELQESDPRGYRQYNQVAGEFQQFQVLLQRFLENEPFQGPRVQNYIKNRCVLRNLLQVPVIKEDSFKNKQKGIRRGGDDAITSTMLTEIIEESMRIFWEFLRADPCVNLKSFSKSSQVELQDPADSKLLANIQANLQKKEKKLKDILRSGKCIVKRLQKHREDRTYEVFFFSQVDIKLVSRVLNMSRITSDQLLWCHKKLSKITFVERKIHREPLFLLFPS